MAILKVHATFLQFLGMLVHLSLPASHFVQENALSNGVVPPGDQEAGQIKGCTPSGWAIPMTCPLKVCQYPLLFCCASCLVPSLLHHATLLQDGMQFCLKLRYNYQ